ncbi:MAG: glycoside hydrolase family 65 [Vicinamibacteria bacterium]
MARAAAACTTLALAAALGGASAGAAALDRPALVRRHDVVLRGFDVESPLSVGNGELAFTADATGLQTFAEAYEPTIPLATLAQWGWHSFPNPRGFAIDRYPFTPFATAEGRAVGYADLGERPTDEARWLRENPHRLSLARIAFRLRLADGREARREDLTDVEQRLDLWSGVLRSRFRLEGEPVEVETLCHPARDLVAVRVVSPLVGARRLAIRIRFPYGSAGRSAADWAREEAHETTVARRGPRSALVARRVDDTRYAVLAAWAPDGSLAREGRHELAIEPAGGAALEAAFAFGPSAPRAPLPTFAESRRAVEEHWARFWSTGGAVDLSASRDPRWRELERRIVLSQYLTAIQCAGRYPPQETGLTYDSWHGKFHLEMHWWHAAHFALWGRLPLLERSLDWYADVLPRARGTAARQGYAGARWPKMTSPSGAESPSAIGPFLVWQQPHPIYYAELVYRERSDGATLRRFREVVFATADFMASFPTWDAAAGRYALGPPLQGAQEIFPRETTRDTAFEVAYWRWGLETAQRWRERMGLGREPRWQRVLDRLPPLPRAEGRYLFAATATGSYSDPRFARDHPSVLGALGMLPGDGVDRETMARTFDWIWEHWSWPDTWGWDYPLVAMSAARLGRPERAIDALLLDTPKNRYRANGHNHQRADLTVYLPGNGGLLAAVAMMAAGWDGAPPGDAPGFPRDGSWTVRWEGLRRMP